MSHFAYTIASVWTAVDLAKSEFGNINLNKKTCNSRKLMYEGEDELHKELFRDQNEGKYGMSINRLEHDTKDIF